jgi:hypothetical protein
MKWGAGKRNKHTQRKDNDKRHKEINGKAEEDEARTQ